MVSSSQPTAASAYEDGWLTLDLDNENKAEYEEFIKSLIEEFPLYAVEEDLRDFDKESADKELKSKIEKCFPAIPGNAASTRQEKSVQRTYSEEELEEENWLLQVRLKHGGRNLDILIRKDNLYLVGYNGKYKFKEKDGTEQADYWIVLKGKNHDEIVKSLQKFPPSTDPLKAVKFIKQSVKVDAEIIKVKEGRREVEQTSLHRSIQPSHRVLIRSGR